MGWISGTARLLVRSAAYLAGIAGFIAGVAAAQGENALAVPLLLLGWFPVVFIHEFGHALAAHFAGWRVWIFHVVPFVVQLRPLSIKFVGNMGGPDLGGFVLAMPRTIAADTWRRHACLTAGGPLASWLLTAACMIAAWMSDQAPDLVLLGLACLSLATALRSSWPMDYGGHANDATLLIDTWGKPNPFAAAESPSRLARMLWAHGVPESFFEPWMRTTDDDANYQLATKFLDRLCHGDETQARAAAEAMAATDSAGPETLIARAFIAAWFESDIKVAENFLAALRAPPKDIDFLCLRQLTLAAIHRLENDVASAERKLHDVRYYGWTRWKLWGSALDALAERALVRRLPSPPHDKLPTPAV